MLSACTTPVEHVGSPAFLIKHGPGSFAAHCRPARTIGLGQHDDCASGTGAFEHLAPPHVPQAAGQQTTEPERGNFFSMPAQRSDAPQPSTLAATRRAAALIAREGGRAAAIKNCTFGRNAGRACA